jgi:hypothetical protein
MGVMKYTNLRRYLQLDLIGVMLLLVAVLLIGCSHTQPSAAEIGTGSSKEEVLALLGEPDQNQDLILPDVPFFGPQEGLANLLPAGTLVEEWVYEVEDDLVYIWFTGEGENSRQNWLVLDTARYPKDAIY